MGVLLSGSDRTDSYHRNPAPTWRENAISSTPSGPRAGSIVTLSDAALLCLGAPPIEANYQSRATQIGLFLDLSGADRYLDRDAAHALSGPGARAGRGGASSDGGGRGASGARGSNAGARESDRELRPGESPSPTLHDDLDLLRPADPAGADHRHYGIFRDRTADVGAIRWFQSGVR